MADCQIEVKLAGHSEWRVAGRFRDDISLRDYGMSAEQLAQAGIDNMIAEYPEDEYRITPCTGAA